MKLRGSGRWPQQLLPMSLGALLLALWSGTAAAQTPIKARLSISSSNTSDTQYPGILLPDGSIRGYGFDSCRLTPAIVFKLDVWIRGQSNPTDVTLSPNTTFSSVPDRMAGENIAILDLGDAIAERKVTYRASYTLNGVTVTDSLTLKMKLFKAPRFYDAGDSQKSLLKEIDALALAVNAWSSNPDFQTHLEQIRMSVSLWWSGRLAFPIAVFGDLLSILGAPPELLIQLSQFVISLRNAGLLNVVTISEGVTSLTRTQEFPPWLPPPAGVELICGPFTVSWFGLGR